MGITGVESYAFAVPSLVALPQFINGSIDGNFINACIVAAASIVITFALTWFFGIEEEVKTEDTVLEVMESGSSDPKKVLAPVKGKVISLDKVNDSAFSSKVMGEELLFFLKKIRLSRHLMEQSLPYSRQNMRLD